MSDNKVFIVLDNPSQRYSPGTVLSGRVVVNTSDMQQQVTKGLQITLERRDVVVYRKLRKKSIKKTTPKVHKDAQSVTLLKVYAFGDGINPMTLAPRHATYFFKFLLPDNRVLRTCVANNGVVEYALTARFHRQWWFTLDYTTTRKILVGKLLDFNRQLPVPKWVTNDLSCELLRRSSYSEDEDTIRMVKFTDNEIRKIGDCVVTVGWSKEMPTSIRDI